MLVVLTGGGTAGHINPALALAEALIERGVDVRFAGTPNGREADLVPAAGIPFEPFEASGFNRNHPTSIVKAVYLMEKGVAAATRWFNEINPNAVVGFGGYVSLAIGRAAENRGIPVVIHEQNSVMGMANKNLAKHAAAICLTYEHAARALSNRANVYITGNPVRRQFFEATREQGRTFFGVPDDATMLLVTGGSLGARHLNQGLCAMKGDLLAIEGLYVIHVTGPKEFEAVNEMLALSPDEAARWRVLDYSNEMGKAMAAADVIVSRAGASSLAEISARELPALLVPFPYATEDHQTTNARVAVEAGCAKMVSDDEIEGSLFRHELIELVTNSTLRSSMREAARAYRKTNAATVLADIVMSVVSTA